MNLKFMFAMIGVLSTLSITGTTMLASQTAVADKDGIPNENAIEGPACDNSAERNDRFHDRLPNSQGDDRDDNENNNKGQETAHDNSAHNKKGVDHRTCQ
jgi:hypothetical protein